MDIHFNQLISNEVASLPAMPVAQLAKNLQVGDLIFIRVVAKPFHVLADVTGGWTNHVGVVIHIDGKEPHIGESTFPFSRTTTLSKFVARSERGRIAVARLKTNLTPKQIKHIQLAAHQRKGVLYDTRFNFHSSRQFCSRYAHEILREATGISIGRLETLKELVISQPNFKVWIMKLWYFGFVPWGLKTMTPISLLRSPEMQPVFYGNAVINPGIVRRSVRYVVAQIVFKPVRLFYVSARLTLKKGLHKTSWKRPGFFKF